VSVPMVNKDHPVMAREPNQINCTRRVTAVHEQRHKNDQPTNEDHCRLLVATRIHGPKLPKLISCGGLAACARADDTGRTAIIAMAEVWAGRQGR
jgi:hypothetical protein